MPYYPPTPPPEAPSEPWPRQYETVTIGISRRHGCELSLPHTMSEEEWAMFDQFLDLIKSAHADTRRREARIISELTSQSEVIS